MRLMQLEQRSSDWMKWRCQGIGSSDIAAIMGVCPYKTPHQVWETLMGFRNDEGTNYAMQRGIDFEDEARKYLGDDNLKPVCIEHDHYSHFHASLDGLGDGYICEIKVPTVQNFPSYEKEIPPYYVTQVQWQLFVTGLHSCTFLAYSPEHRRAHIKTIKRDEEMIEEMERIASKFWDDYINGIEPPLAKNDVLEVYGKEVEGWCDTYRYWHDKKEESVEQCAIAKAKILGFGEGGSFRAYGISAIKTNPKKSYDYEGMKKDGIDIEKYRKVGKDECGYMLRII